jgi:hypothetical protein
MSEVRVVGSNSTGHEHRSPRGNEQARQGGSTRPSIIIREDLGPINPPTLALRTFPIGDNSSSNGSSGCD